VRQAESDFLPNVPASVASEVANSSKVNSKMIPRQGHGVDHAEISLASKLAKTEESRSWTAFSKLNSGVKKKAAYTAATRD
jgi:hypothetical protein